MSAFAVWMLLHFMISALVVWGALRYAIHRRLMDEPGERRSHVIATPRGGGVGMMVAIMLGGIGLAIMVPEWRLEFSLFLLGLVLVAGVGWWDDHKPLSPWFRLGVQMLAAGLLAVAAWHVTGIWWHAMLVFGWAMILTNIWNFMDGINGLACTQAIIAALLVVFYYPSPLGWMAGGLLASCAGFLPFNFPHARIFMGDVGSGGLGFALAGILAFAIPQSPVPGVLLLLPLAPFLVDAGFTLVGRILRGERWWLPHVGHLYQQISRRQGHAWTTLGYATFSLGGVLLALLVSNDGIFAAVPVVIGWYIVVFMLWVGLRIGFGGNVREIDG